MFASLFFLCSCASDIPNDFSSFADNLFSCSRRTPGLYSRICTHHAQRGQRGARGTRAIELIGFLLFDDQFYILTLISQ